MAENGWLKSATNCQVLGLATTNCPRPFSHVNYTILRTLRYEKKLININIHHYKHPLKEPKIVFTLHEKYPTRYQIHTVSCFCLHKQFSEYSYNWKENNGRHGSLFDHSSWSPVGSYQLISGYQLISMQNNIKISSADKIQLYYI